MNGLLRHTGNIHIGMWRNTKSWLGIVWDNIKAGFVFIANGFSTSRTGTVGLTKNTQL